MGFDDLCNTGLVLGLGFSSSTSESKSLISSQKLNHHKITFEPLLTLSLSGETQINNQTPIKKVDYSVDLYRQDSGGGSSFSNVSVKREREMVSEEGEIERVYFSRVSDVDDEDRSNGRKKLRLTKAQSALLEESFKQHSSLNPKQKQELAKNLKLRPRQVEVWFQNRRARTKLKQTEVDCEFLKKCCETLTDENRRLQKELNALKSAQPLYMQQLPAATLTMCPSCERISGPTQKTTKNSFAMAPKPHFYNPFTNSSAAC